MKRREFLAAIALGGIVLTWAVVEGISAALLDPLFEVTW